jgi:hypothetical protein
MVCEAAGELGNRVVGGCLDWVSTKKMVDVEKFREKLELKEICRGTSFTVTGHKYKREHIDLG